jgi:glutamyl-tRNA synthetase
MAEKAKVFYEPLTGYDETAANKFLTQSALAPLEDVLQRLTALNQWLPATIHDAVQETLAHYQLKMPALAQPLRIAITGNTTSPAIDITLYLAGQQRALERITAAIEYLR